MLKLTVIPAQLRQVSSAEWSHETAQEYKHDVFSSAILSERCFCTPYGREHEIGSLAANGDSTAFYWHFSQLKKLAT
jgi:hypothetical protein